MKIKIGFCLVVFLLILSISGVFGYSLNPQLTDPRYDYSGSDRYGSGYNSSGGNRYNLENNLTGTRCMYERSRDIQIVPGSCGPSLIRSDLLEEQNVPVFCKLSSVNSNSFLDSPKIKSIHFRGGYPEGISGVSYFPAKTNSFRDNQNNFPEILDAPSNDGLGYIAIVVSRQSAENNLPEIIEGMITATIDYEIESDYGIGETNFYLNEMSDLEWEENYRENSFWNGRGYIRVDSVESDKATISIYNDVNNRQETVTLNGGETSKEIYFGEDSCSGGMKVRLGKIGDSADSALIKINGEETWISKGDSFLDGKCRVNELQTLDIGGKLGVDCSVNGEGFDLALSPGETKSDRDWYAEGISEKDRLAKGYYDDAIKKYSELFEFYHDEQGPEKNIYAAIGLFEAAQLSKQFEMNRAALGFYDKLIQEYPDSSFAQEAIRDRKLLIQYDFKNSKKALEIEGKKVLIELLDFKRPSTDSSEQAIVKIIPIDYESRTETSFLFRVDIEKRSLMLSPEMAREMADSLLEIISKLEIINEKLGEVIRVMKTACFVTSNLFTSRNAVGGLNGESIARDNLMTSSSGWNDECERLVNEQGYSSLQQCLVDHNDKIEEDVKLYSGEIEKTNNVLKEAGVGGNLDSKVVEDNFKDKFEVWCKDQNGTVALQDKNNTEIPFNGKNGVCSSEDLTHEQRKNIMTLTNVKGSGSDALKGVADKRLSGIVSTNKNEGQEIEETKKGGYKNPIKNPGNLRVKYFEKVPYRGLPAEIPFDVKNGWYLEVTFVSSGFGKVSDNSNKVINYYICNVGPNGIIEFKKGGDDTCRYYDKKVRANLDFPGMNASTSRNLIGKAEKAIADASKQYGKESININGHTFKKGLSFGGESGKCTDSFSPEDCKLLFNVCDPVICPSSRCNFGGKYQVDNVIQTGIVGSLMLCLPNMNEGVVVPICLTGVHAGLEGYISILHSAVDCLEESIATGRSVGICDEIRSVYICELFLKQASPFLGELFGSGFSGVGSTTLRGGGEYSSMNNAWDNTQSSIDYFKEDYSLQSMQAFQSRSITEIGTGVCGGFVSQSIGGGGISEGFSNMGSNRFFEDLMEPDSPVQYHAWFSEIPMGSSTVSTSHYKVYFHIYAGREFGASYNIYLKDSRGSYPVESGSVPIGSQVDRTRDFTAPSGFKQLCVNVNSREECGFGKVSTSYVANSLAESYTQDQIEQEITSEEECMSNSFSDQGDVIRICSTENPGKQTDFGVNQWEEVGYCGDPKLRCWLDTKSVKTVIQNKNVESIETDVGVLLKDVDYITNPESSSLANKIEESISELVLKGEDKKTIETEISLITKDLDELTNAGGNNLYRAKGLYLYGKLYNKISMSLLSIKGPDMVITSGNSEEVVSGEKSEVVWKDEMLKEDVRIVVKRGFTEVSSRFKEGRWISKNEAFAKENLNYVDGIRDLVEGTDFWHEIRIYLTKDYVVVENDFADSDEEMAEEIFEILKI